MIFKSKWSKAIYIVRPTVRTTNHLGLVDIRPGLRATFDDNHSFDSDVAAEKFEWSPEEKLAVEKALLTHKDYGNGLILMPGQDVPEELREAASLKADKTTTPTCTQIDFVEGKVVQCENAALPGIDKCETHREKKGQVVRGMLSS